MGRLSKGGVGRLSKGGMGKLFEGDNYFISTKWGQ